MAVVDGSVGRLAECGLSFADGINGRLGIAGMEAASADVSADFMSGRLAEEVSPSCMTAVGRALVGLVQLSLHRARARAGLSKFLPAPPCALSRSRLPVGLYLDRSGRA